MDVQLAKPGIPDLVQWTVGLVDPDCPPQLFYTRLGKLQLRDRGAVDLIAQLARKADACRERPPLPPFASGDPRVDAFLAAVEKLRESWRQGWPPGLLEATAHFVTREPSLLIDLDLPDSRAEEEDTNDWSREWAPRPHSGTLQIDDVAAFATRPRLRCFCSYPACVHRALALDQLLLEVRRPGSTLVQRLARLAMPAWQRALEQLNHEPPPRQRDTPGTLSFLLEDGELELRFHQQLKRGKRKRGVPLRYDLPKYLTRLSGDDRRIAEAFLLAGVADGRSGLHGDALLLLAGHPCVQLSGDGPFVPAQLEQASVRIEEREGVVVVSLRAGEVDLGEASLHPLSDGGAVALLAAGDRLRIVRVPREASRLAEVTRQHGEQFPREALPGIVKLLPRLEAETQVELPEELVGSEEPARAEPVLRITGTELALRVEPIASGPLFVPGLGVPLATAFDGTRRRFARRALDDERARASEVIAALALPPSGQFVWKLEPGDAGIETLRRIQTLGVRVEWLVPKPRFTRPAELSSLQLRVEKKRDWFGLDGEIQLDERRVTIAALLEAARARRRFVQLGPNEYAALSEKLLEKLQPLAHIAQKNDAITLGALPVLEALRGEVQSLDAAEEWRLLMERLAAAREKPWPLPEGLKASLRDYQLEGYRWLSRLAEWGTGAVLADDMGLGKTLQALALLLQRAPLGPALVVAPSSVLHTWRLEAERFAPSLKLSLFHEGDRDLSAHGPGDVVVVSWSLLARQSQLFAEQKFATAVLDEAQAIKNAGTQRARAAHALQASFVIALSGTPVENHAGELWSLFRAVMPALLGSEESFRARFLNNNPAALRALGALVQPFVLRRTKGEVARELPARTDLDVLVPLSPEERSLYDDVRLAAVAEVGNLTGEARRFDVLAALMRLRLVACHPKLQDKSWQGPASKLARLLELVRDLRASGHRALIFSQFVQHLALVADALRAEGIDFSYIDGQVPPAERQARVTAFQEGRGGELFLISLKAGGTGLTLTAADYVIHLDPWWNPAVEDQASDRAHRIGQTRPVTVYRLVAEGTIEQQILALHREKRELIDALLSGTDRAGKLSAEELASLIRAG